MTISYPLAAGAYAYRPLKRVGTNPDYWQRGWDVVALQLDLPGRGLTIDGVFGNQTHDIVVAFQKAQGLEADGIAGVVTQTEAALELIWPVQARFELPPGLLRGIIEHESAFWVGAYTKPYRNGTRDVGLAQENVNPTPDNLLIAFNGPKAIERTGITLRQRKDYALAEGTKHTSSWTNYDQGAWKYGAVLYHNWPTASNKFVTGDIDTWLYEAYDSVSKTYKNYRMRDRAQWIIDIGVAGVETGYQWADFYISTKIAYVHSFNY